jgi:glucokinase
LKNNLEKHFSLPIAVDNDANVAALAELELGAGKGSDYFLYITLGTGVGGTIVVNRKIFRGFHGYAGEIGHTIINSQEEPSNKKMVFRTGTLEEAIGRNQIIQLAKKIIAKYPNSILHKFEDIDVNHISEATSKNDEGAKVCLKKIGEYLGIGLASALNLLDLNLVIIGGGISQAHDILFESASKTIKKRAMPGIAEYVELRKAQFSKDAGIIGSALLGKQLII